MKIALFYHLPVSGAKRVVFEQTKWLKKSGHTIDIYTLEHADTFFNPDLFAQNTYVYRYTPKLVSFPFIKRLSQDLNDFFVLQNLHKKIAKDIDSRNYDIALIHTDALTQAPFVLRFLKTKNVYFCLEPLRIVYEYGLRIPETFPFVNKLYESINRIIRKKIDRENARASDYSLAISFFGRELMIEAFDLYPKISYPGIDTIIFKKLPVKKKNQILFIGQKLSINGYHYAQQALEYIPRNIRPELKIISWTKNKKERLSDNDLVKLYNESILTLSLSNFDTVGLVPLESLACETPVIAFHVAGYRETMHDKQTGYLVDFNAKEIAEKIITLLKNPELAEHMGKQGKAWIEKQWTWEKQIKNLENILKSIV